MSEQRLEERVIALEEQMAQLLAERGNNGKREKAGDEPSACLAVILS